MKKQVKEGVKYIPKEKTDDIRNAEREKETFVVYGGEMNEYDNEDLNSNDPVDEILKLYKKLYEENNDLSPEEIRDLNVDIYLKRTKLTPEQDQKVKEGRESIKSNDNINMDELTEDEIEAKEAARTYAMQNRKNMPRGTKYKSSRGWMKNKTNQPYNNTVKSRINKGKLLEEYIKLKEGEEMKKWVRNLVENKYPQTTKKELSEMVRKKINEQKPAIAPAKPKTKPKTRPETTPEKTPKKTPYPNPWQPPEPGKLPDPTPKYRTTLPDWLKFDNIINAVKNDITETKSKKLVNDIIRIIHEQAFNDAGEPLMTHSQFRDYSEPSEPDYDEYPKKVRGWNNDLPFSHFNDIDWRLVYDMIIDNSKEPYGKIHINEFIDENPEERPIIPKSDIELLSDARIIWMDNGKYPMFDVVKAEDVPTYEEFLQSVKKLKDQIDNETYESPNAHYGGDDSESPYMRGREL